MTTVEKLGDKPKIKAPRTNQRAIFDIPEKFEGELPQKKSGGRKSLLAPLVEQLKADPGQVYKIAHGLTGTVSQTRTRFLKLDTELSAETHADPDDSTKSFCYAWYGKRAV